MVLFANLCHHLTVFWQLSCSCISAVIKNTATAKYYCWFMEHEIVLGQYTLLIFYKITNYPDPSDHLGRVYFLSLELVLNMVKQHLVSMHHISGTNSLKTAHLQKPSMLFNKKLRLFCFLLPFIKLLFLYIRVPFNLLFSNFFILF